MPLQNAPVFLYDDQCGLCRMWVSRWKEWTGARVTYRAMNEMNRDVFSALFTETDGREYRGAQAIARLLSYSKRHRWFLWMYQQGRPFAMLSEWAYKKITACRPCAEKISNALFFHKRP